MGEDMASASIPNAARAWSHARRFNVSLVDLAPKDLSITMNGKLRVSATMSNMSEADAVVAIICQLAGNLTSHRVMVAGDIYPAHPEKTWGEQLGEFLAAVDGDAADATGARAEMEGE